MAEATNPTNNVQHVSVTEASYVEIKIQRACRRVRVVQLGSETPSAWTAKHRSDAAGEKLEYIGAGGTLSKGGNFDRINHIFQPGSTVCFAQKAGGAGTITLVVIEEEV